jgi:hypothetical protein
MKIYLSLIFLFLYSCTDDTPPFAKRVGYFKGNNKGRAFTYVLPKQYTKDQIKAHALKQMNTPGKMTTVFYYESENKAIDPTQFNTSLFKVIKALSKSDYKYRFDKTPNGESTLYTKE